MNDALISLQHLNEIMDVCSGNFYCKDTDGRYLEVNKNFLVTSDLAECDVIGKRDEDLFWQKQASLLRKNDLNIINKKSGSRIVETVISPHGELQYYSSYKAPLYNNNSKLIGLCGISYLLTASVQVELSKQQLTCLHLLTKGKSMKQIGRILNLSPRTVEHYLEIAKYKLKCKNQAELICKALQLTEIKERF